MHPWDAPDLAGFLVVVLVRHGQTAWNVERRFLGATDVPLDDVGHAQAVALAARIGGFHAVYSSPLSRALDTARRLDPAPRVVDAFREMSQGGLEGLSREEAVARFPAFFQKWSAEPSEVAVPGGESLVVCRARAWDALVGVARAHAPGERVAIVSHQLVLSTLGCTIAGDPLDEWRRHALPNTGLSVLAWNGETFRAILHDYRPGDPS